MSLWLLPQAFQAGNPPLEGLGRTGSSSRLPEHKPGMGQSKTTREQNEIFPSTQGISTQPRGAVPTRMSLLGIPKPKDQNHISKLQTTLICTTCQQQGTDTTVLHAPSPHGTRERKQNNSLPPPPSSFLHFSFVCFGIFFVSISLYHSSTFFTFFSFETHSVPPSRASHPFFFSFKASPESGIQLGFHRAPPSSQSYL